MPVMYHLFRWSWILGIALFVPVALPAGGAHIRRRVEIIISDNSSANFFAGENCLLQVSPMDEAKTSRKLTLGTPLKALQSWKSLDGKEWLLVKTSFPEFSRSFKRGWIAIS